MDIAGLLTEAVREMHFRSAESMNSGQMVKMRLILNEQVYVGHGGQVNRLTDTLAYKKWPMDQLRYEVAGEGWVMGVPG
jgi:hypothetical protein